MANRVWARFLGRGLVEPVDDFRASNPPLNARLLDAMACDLAEHRFDVQHLMRAILRSRVYQLASTPAAENRADTRFYSRYYPRRLTSEQILDALGDACGRRQAFTNLPADLRALQLPDTKVPSAFLDSFGRPLRRRASCECERREEPNLGQALELMHSSLLHDLVTADGAVVARAIEAGSAGEAIIEEIYLRCLSRPPRSEEKAALLGEYEKGAAGAGGGKRPQARREFFEDLLWAVLNSKEFLFNH
jgi:hypothetical protein